MEDILVFLATIWVTISGFIGNIFKTFFGFIFEITEKYMWAKCLLIAWFIGLLFCVIKEIRYAKWDWFDFKEKSKKYTETRDCIELSGNVKFRSILKRPFYRYVDSCKEHRLDEKLWSRMYDCNVQKRARDEGDKVVHEKSLISALTGSLYKGAENGMDYLSYILPVYPLYNVLYEETDWHVWRKRLGAEECDFIKPYRENPFLYARYGSIASVIGLKSCAMYLKDIKGLADKEYIYYHLYATCMEYKVVGDKYYLYVRDPYNMLQLDITDIATDFVKDNIRSYAYDTDKASLSYDMLHYKPIAFEVKGTYDDIMSDRVLKVTWIKMIGYKEASEIMTLNPDDVDSYDFDYELKYYKEFSSNSKMCCGQIECLEEMHRYRDDIVRYIAQKKGLRDDG